MKEALVS